MRAVENNFNRFPFRVHSRLRLMFSTSTVASSTRIPTASASPPSVMMLMVSPRRQHDDRRQNGQRNGRGNNQRASPTAQENQNHQSRQAAAIRASRTTPLIAPEQRWIDRRAVSSSAAGSVAAICGSSALIAGDHFQCGGVARLLNGQKHDRWPLTRTILVCGGKPSRTQATSFM